MSHTLTILRGYAKILRSQLPRLLGYSYYRLGEHPLAVGCGAPVTLRFKNPPPDGPGWCVAGELVVHSGRVMVFDPLEGAGPLISVPVGRYACEVQRHRIPGYGRRNIRVRVLWADAEGEVNGEPVTSIGVDLGMLILADADFTRSGWYRARCEESSFNSAMRADGRQAWWQLPPAADIGVPGGAFAFRTGLGDGLYGVYELRAGSRAVGLLVDMTTETICLAAVKRQGWRQRRRTRRELPHKIAAIQTEVAKALAEAAKRKVES